MRIRGNFWLILGTIAYLSILLYSLSLSLVSSMGLLANLEIALDWVAAALPYFFIGASIGFIFDRIATKVKPPLWLYLSISFYLISVIVFLLFSAKSFFLGLILPLGYGIFFIGAAYVALVLDFLKEPYFSKAIFNLILIFLFAFWLRFTVKNKNHYLKTPFLIIFFLIMIIGMIKSILIFLL